VGQSIARGRTVQRHHVRNVKLQFCRGCSLGQQARALARLPLDMVAWVGPGGPAWSRAELLLSEWFSTLGMLLAR
jgi:hypothetical protein